MRHLRTIAAIAALALALSLVGGCSGTPSTPGGSGAAPGGSGSAAAPSAVSVSMANTAFDPADVTVAVGGTVTFTNNDSFAHNVAGDGWESGNMAAGATFSHTFTTAGTFPIRCTIHPSMTGSVTVK